MPKAIDSIDLPDDITKKEQNKLIDTLLDDLEIKDKIVKASTRIVCHAEFEIF